MTFWLLRTHGHMTFWLLRTHGHMTFWLLRTHGHMTFWLLRTHGHMTFWLLRTHGHMTFWLLRTHGHMTSTATNPCAVGRRSHDPHAVITCLVIGWVSHASRITTYEFKDEKKIFFAQLSTVIKYTRCS